MLTVYLYTFISVLAISLISFVGVFTLSLKEEVLRKYIFLLISIAVGALLGDSLIHLVPEALEGPFSPVLGSILVIIGVLLFFVLEKFLHWHHHGEDKEESHVHPVGKLILFSDAVHNFIDGMIIAASFLVSIPLGMATTLAVVLHEIPQEIGDFAVLLHSGYTKKRALWLNFLSALAAMLGAIALFVIGERATMSVDYLLPIAAGGFIYIAIADLMPELNKTKSIKHALLQFIAIGIGVGAMVALTFLE